MYVKNQYYNEVSIEKAVEESFQLGKTSYSYFHKSLSAVPEYRTVILTCMDCRLLSESFGISKPGKTIFIRTAGALFTKDTLRSLLIAIYELKTEFVAIVGHNDCGGKMSESKMNLLIKKISQTTQLKEKRILEILHTNSASEEFLGFDDEKKQILETVTAVKRHPLIPKNIMVSGYLYDHSNGKISKLL